MTIRAGIVGLGFMGSRYLEFLQKLDGVAVTALCDLREGIAEEFSRATGARAVVEAEELAAAPDVDAVFVCTPEDRHAAVAVAALAAGKAVLIEKPLAHSLTEARAIVAAAEASGAVVMVGHLLRFEPRWAAAQRAIAAGELGEVLSIATRRVGSVLDQQVLGGRTTIPLYYGVHDLDIVRWFAGAEATTLYASRRSGVLQSLGYPVHDLYCAVLEFDNGVLATAELGWHVPAAASTAPTAGVTVVGTRGWLEVDQGATGLRYWSETDAGSRSVNPILDVAFWSDAHGVPGGALANELRHFLACVRTRSQPIISLEDAFEALRLSLAMEASADRSEAIQLADF